MSGQARWGTVSRSMRLRSDLPRNRGRAMPASQWENWSGSLRFEPDALEAPRDEESVRRIIVRAAESRGCVRAVGAGHSSSPLVATQGRLISLEHLNDLESHDTARKTATIGAGMTLSRAGAALFDVGLAMHNLGDIDEQTVTGAIATGTHGSGGTLQNLATMLVGGRVIDGTGRTFDFDFETDPQLVRAARCSLGLLGVFVSIRLQLVEPYRLDRKESWARTDAVLAALSELIDRNRNFDFYWYPRSDGAKVRTMNENGQAGFMLPEAKLDEATAGWSHEVLSKTRTLKFDEIEYAMPRAAGPACFQALRERIKTRHRKHVAWRVLYRTVAKDDAFLSPAHGRDTVTISVHHNAGLPYDEFFADMESIFRAHEGRPHWGKKHTATRAEIEAAYPDVERFCAIRKRFDPNGVFTNTHLSALFGGVAQS